MADRTCITVFFPTPLIFRYHLPVRFHGFPQSDTLPNLERQTKKQYLFWMIEDNPAN
jgi:hypothetical protein